MNHDELLTIKEASRDYFQGQVSEREVYKLYHAGHLQGFRVGTGKKKKILLYKSSLDAYRQANANQPAPDEERNTATSRSPPTNLAEFFKTTRGSSHGERTWITDYRTADGGDNRHPSLRLCACI
jgi:hypothetical protein